MRERSVDYGQNTRGTDPDAPDASTTDAFSERHVHSEPQMEDFMTPVPLTVNQPAGFEQHQPGVLHPANPVQHADAAALRSSQANTRRGV